MWCVSGRPLRSSGEGMGRTSPGLCLEMESFSSSRTPSPECSITVLPVLLPKLLLTVCHTGREGGHLLRMAYPGPSPL